MATLNIRVIESVPESKYDFKTIFAGNVVAKKMTNSWMKSHYGNDWRDAYNEMYLCHKNPYGLVWVIRANGRYDSYDTFADNGRGEIRIPTRGKFIYSVM